MRKFGVLSFALLLMVSSTVVAADSKTVKSVVFSDKVQDGKVSVTYEPIVKAVKATHPKATFGIKGDQLLVGIPGVTDEVRFDNTSDCPVNSQFQQKGANNKIAGLVRPMLEAWTRVRHGDDFSEATVNRYNNTGLWHEVVLNEPKKDLRSTRR